MTRRELLRRVVLGSAGWVVLGHRGGIAQAAAAAPPAPAPNAKAKAVIQIWMWGGPTHNDTFDPKPAAGRDYCGPLDHPIATNVAGIQIGELLPLLAKQADKYSIIRSMTHGNNGHETASYLVQTGRPPGERLVYPGAGAIVSAFKGYDQGYKGLVPPYIVLTRPQGRFSEAGFLGNKFKPFATGGDPNARRFVVDGVISENVTDEQQKQRRELLHRLDSLGQALPGTTSFDQLDQAEAQAYEMILGDGAKLFDLAQEKDDVRELYGRNTFGQSCLMARRLVEKGVPYVTINYSGWDTHKQHFETMRRKLPEMDKGMSALIGDLSQRGLLDSTIVWWCGEFGRTPKVAWEEPWNGGRHHYGQCFGAVLAGGGFKGGHVVGASDAKAEQPAERPVKPQDVIGSIYTLLGIDPNAPLPNPNGEPLTVTAPGWGKLTEIM